MLFAVNATTREVTATIQIAYSGNASDFSWVLPLPATPQAMGISSDSVFRALHSFTDPTFSLNIIAPTGCTTARCASPSPRLAMAAGVDRANSARAESVEVVAAGEVGPFVFQVIQAKATDAAGQALFDWLKLNSFGVSDTALPIVARYVRLSYRFVTLKLQKGKTAGELVPIVIKYIAPSPTDLSCVPLRLTAIAAQEMPVFVWIAGKERAVPQNFVHITPDLRTLPWTECAAPSRSFSRIGVLNGFGGFSAFGSLSSSTACTKEYIDLLKSTAKSFGMGKWLTTEFAGPISADLLTAIYDAKSTPFNKTALVAAKEPAAFLTAALRAIPIDLRTSPVMQQLLREFIPKPAAPTASCTTDAQFYSLGGTCLQGYVGFNSKTAADAVESRLIEPTRQTRAELAKHKYLTRAYGMFAPENMVRDPIFRFATGLPDVSNVHRVNVTYACPPVNATFPVTLTFADGSKSTLDGARFSECTGLQLPPAPKTPINDEPTVEVIQANPDGSANRSTIVNEKEALSYDQSLAYLDGMPAPSVDGVDVRPGCNRGSNGCGCLEGECANQLACNKAKDLCVPEDVLMRDTLVAGASSNRGAFVACSTLVVAAAMTTFSL